MKKRLMAILMASMFVLSTACGTKQTEGGNDAAANEYAEAGEEQSAEEGITADFKLVEPKSEIINSKTDDPIIQIEDQIIRTDGSQTLRQVIDTLHSAYNLDLVVECNNVELTEEYLIEPSDGAVFAVYDGLGHEFENTIVNIVAENNDMSETKKAYDCPVTGIKTVDFSIYSLNVFYAGNICAGLLDDKIQDTALYKERAERTEELISTMDDEVRYANVEDQRDIPIEKQIEMFAWYTTTDWPVDPRWDEHEGVACAQVGDMFFWDDMSYEDYIKEIKSSSIKDLIDIDIECKSVWVEESGTINIGGPDDLPATYDDLCDIINKDKKYTATPSKLSINFKGVDAWYNKDNNEYVHSSITFYQRFYYHPDFRFGHAAKMTEEQEKEFEEGKSHMEIHNYSKYKEDPCRAQIESSFIRYSKDQELIPVDWDRILNDYEYADNNGYIWAY